jgi:hypothetical protein
MYENGTMRPVETILRSGGNYSKNDGVDESNEDILSSCKCHSVSPVQQ